MNQRLSLFDTHAHLNTDPFDNSLDAVIDSAKTAGVEGIAVIGIDRKTSERAVQLADLYPGYLHAVVGIQPNSVAEASETDFGSIEEMAQNNGVVGIGETGLDCYWDDTPIDQQQMMFDRHIDLCLKTNKPMIIHMRDSGELIARQLEKHSSIPSAVMHSYTGDLDLAERLLEMGLMFSFAGMVTFKKSNDLRDVAARVPDDRLLVETDSPYLSPEPMRGKRPNEPARVEHTLRCLADARGASPEKLAKITTENARRFFGLAR
ncbi:MAG: TatD family hydrolase [Planctomycetota bacterium]